MLSIGHWCWGSRTINAVMLKGTKLGNLSGATPGAATYINQYAAQYGIPPQLLMAVAQQESGLNQNAVSSAGAVGVMQLLPSTAAGLGVNPNDLQQNIQGGAKYLSQMYQQFGSWDLALAAYNAGPGAVSNYGGIPPYPETQNYVSTILANAGMSDSSGGSTDTSSCDPSDPSCTPTDNSGNFPMSAVLIAVAGIGFVWFLWGRG